MAVLTASGGRNDLLGGGHGLHARSGGASHEGAGSDSPGDCWVAHVGAGRRHLRLQPAHDPAHSLAAAAFRLPRPVGPAPQIPSPKRAPVAEVQRLLALYRERYQGFNVRTSTNWPGVSTVYCYAFVKKALQTAGLVAKRQPGGVIAAAGSRALASVNCYISTAVGITGWRCAPSSGSPSSQSSTPRRSACSTPNCATAGRVWPPS